MACRLITSLKYKLANLVIGKRALVSLIFFATVWMTIFMSVKKPPTISSIAFFRSFVFSETDVSDIVIKPPVTRNNTAIFIIYSSTKVNGPSNSPEVDSYWSALTPPISECRRISSPSPCRVFLIFYADDSYAMNTTFQNGIHAHVNRTRVVNHGTAQRGGKYEEFYIRKIAERKEDARQLNAIALEAYIDMSVDYFYFVFLPLKYPRRPENSTTASEKHSLRSENSTVESGITTTQSSDFLRGGNLLRTMKRSVAEDSHSFSDIGVSILESYWNSGITSGPSRGSGVPVEASKQGAEGKPMQGMKIILVSRIHLEIFGAFFPHDIPSLAPALVFLTSALYPATFVRRFDSAGNEVSAEGLPVTGQGSQGLLAPLVAEGAQGKTTPGSGVTSTTPKELSTNEKLLLQGEKAILERYLQAMQMKQCLRCNLKSYRNVIAMSLYGSNRRYTIGALRNAQLFPIIYPGWRLRFYCEAPAADGKTKHGNIPHTIISKIKELGAEIRYIDPKTSGLAPMLWRFLAAEDPEVEAFIIRDSDSRLTPRDAAVVNDWLKTGKAFHCIRDHPSHSNYAVSGGLWGGRRAQINAIFGSSLGTMMKKYGGGYVEDMNFLGHDVWPKVKDSHAYCHDSFSCEKYESSHPFPVVREGSEHLGEVYDEFSKGRSMDINILMSRAVNKKCVPSS